MLSAKGMRCLLISTLSTLLMWSCTPYQQKNLYNSINPQEPFALDTHNYNDYQEVETTNISDVFKNICSIEPYEQILVEGIGKKDLE